MKIFEGCVFVAASLNILVFACFRPECVFFGSKQPDNFDGGIILEKITAGQSLFSFSVFLG